MLYFPRLNYNLVIFVHHRARPEEDIVTHLFSSRFSISDDLQCKSYLTSESSIEPDYHSFGFRFSAFVTFVLQ